MTEPTRCPICHARDGHSLSCPTRWYEVEPKDTKRAAIDAAAARLAHDLDKIYDVLP